MKSISTKELQRTLSLYLDGALDEEARNRFEEYLAESIPTLRRNCSYGRNSRNC